MDEGGFNESLVCTTYDDGEENILHLLKSPPMTSRTLYDCTLNTMKLLMVELIKEPVKG